MPLVRSDVISGFTSLPSATKSPVIAALPPPVGSKLIAIASPSHGGPSTTYDYLVGDLAPVSERFTLVFHDYRGSRRSDGASRETYTFERLADDVDELRQHLGVARVSVLTHSMGGFVALQYALRHREHCRSLALISSSPAGTMRRTAWLTLRALGIMRTVRMLGRAVWYVGAWSWRRESDAKTASRYSIMHIMQEGNPAFREAVAAREVLAQNDNAATLERAAHCLSRWPSTRRGSHRKS